MERFVPIPYLEACACALLLMPLKQKSAPTQGRFFSSSHPLAITESPPVAEWNRTLER